MNTKDRYNLKNRFLKWAGFLAMAFLIAFFPGCGTDSYHSSVGAGPDKKADGRGTNEVWMEETSFNPQNLQVTAGTTVKWTNKSNQIHTVSSGSNGEADSLFNSGDLGNGETYSHTFNRTGTYNYFCEHHSGMTGIINVVEMGGY